MGNLLTPETTPAKELLGMHMRIVEVKIKDGGSLSLMFQEHHNLQDEGRERGFLVYSLAVSCFHFRRRVRR